MQGFLVRSLLTLVIIGIACLPATDANREREKRSPQGNLVCPDRNPSDYGLPYSQIATALREVHNAMQILNKLNVSNNSLPVEIDESLVFLLYEEFNVSSVEFMQQLQLYQMVMKEVSKKSDRRLKKSLGALVNKVRDVQNNLTCLCHVASGRSGECQQPDNMTRVLGSVQFPNRDHSMEAGACVLVMMNRTLTSVENSLHLIRSRRGSNQGQKGRQQKRIKGKGEEVQVMTTPDDYTASRVLKKPKKAGDGVAMLDLIKPKKGNKKGDNSRKEKGGGKGEKKQPKNKKKQPKDKKGGNKKSKQQQ
ncbi:uncharacterized protein LOC112564951 isoform X2 [Pomacea canaliculata]|uniref:uncharacterized protein LOC112564951 isoform X2 n=1 Tax=Pomacea canaliculata TaxID=400727 RepID=UPI000D73E28C|nr:uncharacterized protein LOC112564951 isoform X2 [Pomacea canaliculata]